MMIPREIKITKLNQKGAKGGILLAANGGEINSNTIACSDNTSSPANLNKAVANHSHNSAVFIPHSILAIHIKY